MLLYLCVTSLHLELTDSGPTFASNFSGGGCGGVSSPAGWFPPRSAPPADGVVLELFSKVG